MNILKFLFGWLPVVLPIRRRIRCVPVYTDMQRFDNGLTQNVQVTLFIYERFNGKRQYILNGYQYHRREITQTEGENLLNIFDPLH